MKLKKQIGLGKFINIILINIVATLSEIVSGIKKVTIASVIKHV